MEREEPVQTSQEPESDEATIAFAAQLAAALHRFGSPADQLEEVIERTASKLGQEGNYFSLPTSFMAAFGPFGRQQVVLVRVEPGDLNLEKLAQLGEVTDQVANGRMGPDEGRRAIETISTAPSRYGSLLSTCCASLSSGASARFFGGGWREIVASAFIGFVVGLLAVVFARSRKSQRIFEPAAALVATVLALVAAWWLGPMSTSMTILGGMIMLVPGFAVTVAMSELTSRHLMSGTGRLMGAFTVFLIIGLGVILGGRLAAALKLGAGSGQERALPPWTWGLALVVGLISLAVIFRAPPRDFVWILAGGVVANWAAHFLGPRWDAELSAGLAALILGLWANIYSRLTRRPATVPLVPGLVLLVPGSMGLRSLLSMMDQNILPGVEGAFQVIMMAITLTTGLLLANILIPSRRAL